MMKDAIENVRICVNLNLLTRNIILVINVYIMRPDTNSDLKTGKAKNDRDTIDIIQETRRIVKPMDEKQRFAKAKNHLFDALSYKTPRLDIYSLDAPLVIKRIYKLQTSGIWQRFLLILSYIFMYMIAINTYPQTGSEKALEIIILTILWIDVVMEVYHKKFQILRITSRFQTRFYFRIILLCTLFVDEVAFFVSPTETPFRPFLALRCFLPLFYDTTARKAFEAIMASYKDIFVYIFFYTLVIITFAIISNQVIQLPEGTEYDDFTQNYGDLGKMIFIMYVLSSYDAYPDNQLLAIQNSIYVYWFFILFIFLNVFFFVTIPTTILFNSFRETRSKTILIDEIKQQHSLIMAFVSLGEDNLNISQNKLIRFLLYVYKNKVRYVDYITEICLKLDDNNNNEIQVNQFMQLCKILQANSSMLPPLFHDWAWWLKLRKKINGSLKLKAIILSKRFRIFISILIVLTFINCALALYTEISAFNVIDDVLMVLYCLEILFKLIGLGPENYFRNPWNKLDFFLIIIGLVLQLSPADAIPKNSDVLFKMTRIFRVSLLINLLSETHGMNSEVYMKSKRLISQMAIIIPIVNKFMPIYFISYYILGVIGMQVFQSIEGKPPSQSPYNTYHQFSNFQSFFGTQYIFVQVLVEAGWSMIAYDHAYRYGGFAITMLFFVLSHIVIVVVLSSLLKGIAWQVYSAVHDQFNERKVNLQRQISKENQLQKKKKYFQDIRAKIQQQEKIFPNSIITKQIFENKIDLEIFKKIKNIYKKNQLGFSGQEKNKRSKMISLIMEDRNIPPQEIIDSKRKIIVDEIESMDIQSSLDQNQQGMTISRLMESLNLQDIQDLTEEDFEEEMEKVLSKIILHHKITFFQTIAYPAVFIEFLDSRLKEPMSYQDKGFNIEKDVIGNQESINFLTYELNVLLGIEKSEREQKAIIIQNMVNEDVISEEDSVKILTKKLYEKDNSLDSRWIMRKMFLCDTNELLIKKFQIEYFSSVYGKSFKEINKVTIEPLLRLEARLTYCLSNALRYRQIDNQEFFTILSTIEDTISNKLLKKGSLFKFVYQIDGVSQNWFSIEVKESKELKVHFIKSGLWVYNKSMKPDVFKYGRDIFYWKFDESGDSSIPANSYEKYIKRFFQAFESLAFCLVNQKNFFESNPQCYIYDLFTFYKDVSESRRFVQRKLSIGKIMLVILSKEEERDEPLTYQLTDIKREVDGEEQNQKSMMFKIDESENQTFKKLKRIQLMDYEKIVETEGLPFSFILNMMTEIKNIVNLYETNFIYQIQKVLNAEFDQIKDQ